MNVFPLFSAIGLCGCECGCHTHTVKAPKPHYKTGVKMWTGPIDMWILHVWCHLGPPNCCTLFATVSRDQHNSQELWSQLHWPWIPFDLTHENLFTREPTSIFNATIHCCASHCVLLERSNGLSIEYKVNRSDECLHSVPLLFKITKLQQTVKRWTRCIYWLFINCRSIAFVICILNV